MATACQVPRLQSEKGRGGGSLTRGRSALLVSVHRPPTNCPQNRSAGRNLGSAALDCTAHSGVGCPCNSRPSSPSDQTPAPCSTKDTYSTAARRHLHALQSLFRHALHHHLPGALLFSLSLTFPCTCLQIQRVVDQHFSELCCVVSCVAP